MRSNTASDSAYVRRACLAHELDGHRALERAVRTFGAVHAAHAALAEQLLHAIRAELLGRRRLRLARLHRQSRGHRDVGGLRRLQQLAHIFQQRRVVRERFEQPLLALIRGPVERGLEIFERESFVREIQVGRIANGHVLTWTCPSIGS
jgi:hypothetical protein